MPTPSAHLSEATTAFYRHAMALLRAAGVPFLVGGAYAFARYTGIVRHTKDFDVFVREGDLDRALAAFEAAGYATERSFPHWLAKAYHGEDFVDLIFATGNGVSVVDEGWFERAPEGEVLGETVRLCAAEDILWTKAFILERERCDAADVAHLLLCRAVRMDWDVLMAHFEPHWRVLLAHLVLFGFSYPSERHLVPRRVMETLMERLRDEVCRPPATQQICYGTLTSRAQYLVDVEAWGYKDGRRQPEVAMEPGEIAHWTAAIDDGVLPAGVEDVDEPAP